MRSPSAKNSGRAEECNSNVLVFAKRSLNLSKILSGSGAGSCRPWDLCDICPISSCRKFKCSGLFPSRLVHVSWASDFCYASYVLYVYDKNNGVLEYLLSLGWNQSDIFKQYLKAALFLALILFIGEGAAILIAGAIAGLMAVFALDLLMLFLTAFMGFSVVSLVNVAMMAFSSLQKQRVGANTPLGMAIGVPFIFPTFYLSFLGFSPELIIYLLLCTLAAALSVALLLLSSRLIRREKCFHKNIR